MAETAAPKTTRTRAAKPDVIDQLADALGKPADDAERQKVEAFLDAKIDTLIAERGSDRPRNIIEALVECMRRVSHVGKESRNEQGRGYNFRGIDAVVNALGPVMREVGVVVGVEVRSYTYGDVEVGKDRTRQAHSQVQVAYSFSYSNAHGAISTHTSVVPGEAMDSGDKATAKSMSVAMRIALLQTFALPTDEPDPDAFTYERSAAPRKTANDVYAGLSWARGMDDLDAAFAHIKDTIGADLFSITCQTRAGDDMRADRYLEHAEAQMREERARAASESQDAAAHAPESAATPDVDARADEAVRADAPRPGGDAPAPTQSRDDQPPATPPVSREAKHLALVRDELTYQAQTLGIPFGQYAADLLDADGNVAFGKAQKFAVAQRPEVIARLREQGAAEVAARYEGYGDSPLLVIEQVVAGADYHRTPVEQPA